MNYAISRKRKWLPSLASLMVGLLLGGAADGQESMLRSVDVASSERISRMPLIASAEPVFSHPQVREATVAPESDSRIGQVVNIIQSCGRDLSVRIRPQDDVWLVSARECDCTPWDLSLLNCSRLEGGAWKAAELDELISLHSTDKTKVTMLYAHGNRTELKWAKTRGLQFYKNGLNSFPRPPLRFVIFAWRSESEIARVIRDFKVKSKRSVTIGETFGTLLCRFEDRKMVIAGFSLGAQVVLTGLAKQESQLENERIGKYRVAIFAPALNPVFIQSDLMTLSQNPDIQQTEVFLNRRDFPIKVSQLIARRRTNSSYSVAKLGYMSHESCNPITIHDITREVKKRHSIVNYSRSTCVACKLAELLNSTFAGGTGLPAMIEESIESEIAASDLVAPELVSPEVVAPILESVAPN